MKRLWMGCLGVALALTNRGVHAEDLRWTPVNAPAATPAPGPVGISLRAPESLQTADTSTVSGVQTTVYTQDEIPNFRIVRAQGQDPFYGPSTLTPTPAPPPPPYPGPGAMANAPADEKLNCAVTVNSSDSQGFWDQTRDGITGIPQAFGNMFTGGGRNLFQSDHCFDMFSSPVSNPFYFSDPRSLTEIKPLLLYQQVPGSNPAFQGGSIWFYGVQGSVAITDMFSIVLDKLGAVTISPNSSAHGVSSTTGFAELELGPKFTFLRLEQTKTILAAGLNFDFAVGNTNAFQGTGDLSLIPYISVGQNFGSSSYGSFNFLNTTGYSFATDNTRPDFLYSSFHLDYNVGNLNKIFPLVEMNYFHYTTNGNSPEFFGFEGRDLMTFGSGGVAGHNDLSIAVGLRYKFTEWFQAGFAAEFPLLSEDLMSYRLGFDVIFRY